MKKIIFAIGLIILTQSTLNAQLANPPVITIGSGLFGGGPESLKVNGIIFSGSRDAFFQITPMQVPQPSDDNRAMVLLDNNSSNAAVLIWHESQRTWFVVSKRDLTICRLPEIYRLGNNSIRIRWWSRDGKTDVKLKYNFTEECLTEAR